MSERLKYIDEYHIIYPDINGEPEVDYISEGNQLIPGEEQVLDVQQLPEGLFLNHYRSMSSEDKQEFVDRHRDLALKLDGPGGP